MRPGAHLRPSYLMRDSYPWPQNLLRQVARDATEPFSKFSLVVDVDLVPSRNLSQEMRAFFSEVNVNLMQRAVLLLWK